MKTVILGGGLAGVTLARLLKEKGEDVVVLEGEDTIGGLCRSRQEKGFTFDIGGSHILFSRDQEVLSFMNQMIEGNREQRDRNTKIFYKGRYVKYPFENGLSDLPPDDRFFCLHEYIKNLIALEKGELSPPKTFLDWIYYTFGKGIAETYMVPYNEKIWNYSLDRMSLHWVDGRVPKPPVEDIIRSAIGIETTGYAHQAVFSYPARGGIASLIDVIADPIKDRIKTGFIVRSVKRTGNSWTISDGTETITADHCISTIPLQVLAPCIADISREVIDAIGSLVYNSICCIGIGIRGDVPPVSWMYIPEKNLTPANRISFPSGYSSFVSPPGHSSVLAEITYNAGDCIDLTSDADLTMGIITSLEEMNIIKAEDVRYTTAARSRFAYVVYDSGYEKNIATIRDYFEDFGISLLGRFSQFEYLNMDGVIRSVLDYVKGR